MNKTESNRQIALDWIEAFNEHNLEKLLRLYDNNAIHFSPKLKVRMPETSGWIKGKDQLRSWWNDAFQRLPSLRYELKNLIINDDQILMEYLRTVNGEEEMMIAEILEIASGVVIRSRVYHS